MEKIICSAVWFKDLSLKKEDWDIGLMRPINCDKGIVFCGHRHHQCIYQMVAMTGLRQCEVGEDIQGFLTNKNRFVDRFEGAKIFLNESPYNKLNFGNKLYSEDLY